MAGKKDCALLQCTVFLACWQLAMHCTYLQKRVLLFLVRHLDDAVPYHRQGGLFPKKKKKKKVLLRCRLKKCIMDGNVRAKKSFKHRSIRVFVNMHHT